MKQISQTLDSSAADLRSLKDFLTEHGVAGDVEITALTPDASTRRYFRVPWKGGAAVVALYPEPFDAKTQPFLDATELFVLANLPVPQVVAVDERRGIIAQEDLGDRQLRDALAVASDDEAERLTQEAICLIARIQKATSLAFERDAIASRLAFDTEKLEWELNFFVEHYFGSLRRFKMSAEEASELREELRQLAADLAARPRVLCHRDFHSSNLIVDPAGDLRIIDYQDARMGPASYDLVSIVLDRQLAPPPAEEVRGRRAFFLAERERAGLERLDPEDFAAEFDLMTVQRCLKAAGTFSFQTAVRGRGDFYGKFINPMLAISLRAAERLDRFPRLQKLLSDELAG